MILAMVTTLGSAIVSIATHHDPTWQFIAAMWIGVSMFKQGSIDKITKL